MTGGSRQRRRRAPICRSPRTGLGLAATAVGLLMTSACADTEAMSTGDVYRVEIEACAGISYQRATAMAVGPNLVATAAHTFETARSAVLRRTDGSEVGAEIVYLDLERDVALLSVDVGNGTVFRLGEAIDDADVTIPTYADPDGVQTKQATVLRSVTATLDGEGRRQAVELAAAIDQGDSGAPVVDEQGRAVAMVFASSRREDRGWAVAAAELTTAIEAVTAGDGEPLPSRCRS